MVNFDFIKFLENEESGYLNNIQDKLGIDPKSFIGANKFSSNVNIGNVKHDGILYKISRISYKDGDVNGAFLIPTQSVSSSYKNKLKIKEKSVPSTEVFIDLKTLNSLLSQGFSSVQPVGGGMF